MKLCTFAVSGPLGEIRRVGIVRDRTIIDATAARVAYLEQHLSASAAARVGDAQVPSDMLALIGSGPLGLQWAEEALDYAVTSGREATRAGARVAVKNLRFRSVQDLGVRHRLPFAAWRHL